MSEDLLTRPAVKRVAAILAEAGNGAEVIALEETARTAEDAASSLGCPLGAIVKSLVFTVGGQPVMALVAGDRRCDTKALAGALGLEGKAKRADADVVRDATGYSIGGVAPVGHPQSLPIVIDASLARFERVFAAAGHPHCVFGTSVDALAAMTGAPLDGSVGLEG